MNEKQREGESMDAFANRLMIMDKDCDYVSVTPVEHNKEAVLQSFVSGLEDPFIWQRIPEKDDVDRDGYGGIYWRGERPKCRDI